MSSVYFVQGVTSVCLSVQLFDHIAACLYDFLVSKNLKGQTLPLGFTFSFPCEQKDIDKVSHTHTYIDIN